MCVHVLFICIGDDIVHLICGFHCSYTNEQNGFSLALQNTENYRQSNNYLCLSFVDIDQSSCKQILYICNNQNGEPLHAL